MKSKENGVAIGVALLLALVGYGVFKTAGGGASADTTAASTSADVAPVVDRRALATVQELVRLPTTADELPLAREAFRLADQDMDLAFAGAVREAAAHPQPMTDAARTIADRLQQVLKELAADQALVTQLKAEQSKPAGANLTLDDQLDLAKARVELDQDEVDDAREDLIHAGGDPPGRMQSLVHEHEATSMSSDSTRIAVSMPLDEDGLVRQVRALWRLQQKRRLLGQAAARADSASLAFAQRHTSLDAQDAVKEHRPPAIAPAVRATSKPVDSATADSSHQAAAALLLDTQRRALEEKTKASIEHRGDDQRKLASVFQQWSRAVRVQQRDVVNHALRELALILVIALIGLFSDRWVGHVLQRLNMERRSRQRLHAVVRVSLQVVGLILILIVIFGVPSNVGTIIGLAGAGLTVALKDFIVAFMGWLVLMGKNGIRIGDLVEINGVTGEVVELGMFNTVLLETGNWTDAGHPTGRRVTFTNSYAIEGHYFNFSTSGQWLWDEVRIVVPAGRDLAPVLEALQTHVQEATADSARQAEQEWKGSKRSPMSSAITGAPAITAKPILGGVEIAMRYITHAAERYQLRSKLYLAAVDVLGVVPPVMAVETPEHSGAGNTQS